jgi:hypothetical protein
MPTAVNLWMGGNPYGVSGVFDFDKAVRQNGGLNQTTATLTSGAGGNPVTVASGSGIQVGATVWGSTGIAAGTTATAVSGTSITLSNNPTASGAATLWFQNPNNTIDPDYGHPYGIAYPHPFSAGYERMAAAVHLRSAYEIVATPDRFASRLWDLRHQGLLSSMRTSSCAAMSWSRSAGTRWYGVEGHAYR